MTNIGKLLLFAIFFPLTTDIRVEGEKKFTDLDLNVTDILKKYLNPQYIVYVDSSEDLSLLRGSKTLENNVYYTSLNSSLLEKILGNHVWQYNFFQRRTMIVTKEKLDLTLLLNKITSPHYVSWVIFHDYAVFSKIYIPASSVVIFIQSTPKMVSATQVYHLTYGVNATVNTLWSWDLTRSAIPSLSVEFLKINFQNLSMDMLVLNKKKSCENLQGDTLMKKIECVHQDFLDLMGQRLNFSINFVECQEKEHPYAYPNGSDSELFLKLMHREVNFSAARHVIRVHSKRNFLDFVWPTFVLKSRMYLKQGRLAGRWVTYLRPLESSVWWGILVWIIVTGTLIQIFEKLLVNQLKFDCSLVVDLMVSTLKSLQVFCNQAISDLPTSYSIRIIFFLKFFVVLIFFQAYCGYLVSSLTIVVHRFPFKDLKGFFENNQYQIMTLQRGLHQFYFRKEVGEGEREDFMLPLVELPETIQQAVDKLCTQDYLAFTEFREDFLNFDSLKCKISELPSPIVQVFVGIAMPKQAPLKEFLRRELLFLKSAGLVQKLGSRLSTRSDFQYKESNDDFKTVSMGQIFSVFGLLGVGILLSVVIFIIEKIIQGRRRLFTKSSKFCKKYSPYKSIAGTPSVVVALPK